MEVLFGLQSRQTTGFVESLLRLVDLDWAEPDFSTLCRPIARQAIGWQSLREGSENTERDPAVSRGNRATEPAHPLSWLAGKPLPGSGRCQ